MSDQEKTRFAPRNFGIAAKTVVMDLPPRMTMHLRVAAPEEPRPAQPELRPAQPEPRPAKPGQGFPPALTHIVAPRPALDPRATRMALSAVPSQASAPPQAIEITTGEIIRGPQTRIARSSRPVEQSTALPPLPPSYLEPAKPPSMWPSAPPIEAPNAMVVLRKRLQEKSTRQRVLIGAAALLVALVLLIPLSSSSASSSANASAHAPDKAANNEPDKAANNEPDKAANNEPTQAAAPAPTKAAAPAPTKAAAPAPASAISEELAAAMLLSGRREEALQMYQALAKSTATSPGVEAMVLVLSQKVAAQ